MTQAGIIQMAREAGISESHAQGMTQFLEAFAKLVAEKEREECAKLADVWIRAYDHPSEAIAKSIRARGQQ